MSNSITVTPTETGVSISFAPKLIDVVISGAKVSVGHRGNEVSKAINNIIATIDAINHVDYRDDVINIEGVTYPLSSYQICAEFRGLLMPRKVSITNGYDALNLSKQVSLVNEGHKLTPHEYREAEQIVMSLFKRESKGGTAADTNALALITDAMVISNGDYVAETAGGRQVPVFLTVDLWRTFHYAVPITDYLYQYLLDVKDALRNG